MPSIGNQCAAGLIAVQQEPTLQLQMALEIANGTVEYDRDCSALIADLCGEKERETETGGEQEEVEKGK